MQCDSRHNEQLVAFSCKRRGFCPSCGARRMAESAALLVDEVLPHRPMRQWMLSVPHPLHYLFASQPKVMGKVLGIVYRTQATHLIHKAGYKKSEAHTRAVTLIQRFGRALNLNIHFHMIFLDGVYVDRGGNCRRPTSGAQGLHPAEPARHRRAIHCGRGGRFLAARQRGGQSERAEETRTDLPLHKSPCCVRKTTLIAPSGQGALPTEDAVSARHHTPDIRAGGFHCHKLAALVPRPRVNLTRYHAVFAPNSKHRALVTPARRGKGKRRSTVEEDKEKAETNCHVAMSWAQRLKPVFNIGVERCRVCGGKARVIAAIEDKAIIDKILTHLDNKMPCAQTALSPQVRAPPAAGLFT